MARAITISVGTVRLEAELNDSRTADAIWDVLPLAVRGNCWGDEVYFRIPVTLPTEDGQETVALGDLGYWEPGSAFCIFFGPTPTSRGSEIRPASAVTVVGRCLDDATRLKGVRPGETVRIERRVGS